jgi:hypothetical protein
MAFMSLYSSFGLWYVVDGNCGSCAISADLVPVKGISVGSSLHSDDDGPKGYRFRRFAAALADYYDGSSIYSIELVRGWCARYSAPGYLDCTDWCGPYSAEDEALAECRAVYGDDDEEDEGGEEDSLTQVTP